MNTPAPLVSFPARPARRKTDKAPSAVPIVRPGMLTYPLVQTLLIALSAFTLLFLATDLRVGAYDEGFLLTAAFREMLGQIPHRDFYFAYGPAQTYLLAALFKLFGPSVLVERLYDLVIKAAVVTSVWHFARKFTRPPIALAASTTVFLLLAAISMNGSASVPASLAAFWASWLLIQPPAHNANRNPFLAGLITAVAFFFRYDVGLALCASNLLLLTLLALFQPNTLRERASVFLRPAGPYLFAFGLLILPFTALVRAYGATEDLLFDCVTFPAHFFRAGRNLPFPAIHFRTLDDLAVYLPIPILLAAMLFLFQTSRPHLGAPASTVRQAQPIRPAILAFSLLTLLFYAKGFVRISPVQLYPALVTSTLLLAILIAHRDLLTTGLLAGKKRRLSRPSLSSPLVSSRGEADESASLLSTPVILETVTRSLLAVSLALASISLVWLSLHRILDVRNHHAALLQTLLTSPNPGSATLQKTPINRGLPFTPGDDKQTAINFLRAHTTPLDTLYVGVTHHDRIFANDNLTYFATERLPATKWSEFDPGLQSQLPIQAQMVADLEANQPPYIAIDNEFDQVREPNTSSLSSGVYLFDDYLAQHYHPIQTLPTITLYERLPR